MQEHKAAPRSHPISYLDLERNCYTNGINYVWIFISMHVIGSITLPCLALGRRGEGGANGVEGAINSSYPQTTRSLSYFTELGVKETGWDLEMSPTLGTVCNARSHVPTNAQALEFSYFWNSRLLLYATDGSALHILSPCPDPVCQLLGTLLSSSRNFLSRKSWSGEGSSLCLGERTLSPASTVWAVRALTLAIVEESPGRKWNRWVLSRHTEIDRGPEYTMGIGSGS